MSQQNDARVTVGAVVDKKSIRDGQNAYSSLADAAKDTERSVAKTGKASGQLSNEIKDLTNQYEKLAKAEKEAAEQARAVVSSQGKGSGFGERAGESASQAARVRGGLEDVANVAGIDTTALSSIFQAVEGVSDLGEAAGRALANTGKLSSSLVGAVGLAGAAGLAGVAVAGATIAIQRFIKFNEEEKSRSFYIWHSSCK